MSTKQVYKTKVPSLKNHVRWVQDFSFVAMTSYKLRASTVVNQQNKNKEWWEIRRAEMNYFYTEITPPAFDNGLSDKYRPFSIEYGMLKKLIAVSPDPLEWLKQIKYVGTRLGSMERLWIWRATILSVFTFRLDSDILPHKFP